MKNKLKLLVFFSFAFIFSGISQIKYSNEFMKIGAGAHSLSLYKSVVAGTANASSIYWNPASLVEMSSDELEFMHASYFSGIANFDQISYVSRLSDGDAFGLMLLRFGIDDIMNTLDLLDDQGNVDYDRITLFSSADYAFFLSYARDNIYKGLSVGSNVKIIYRKIGSFAYAWGFGFDLSAKQRVNDWIFGCIVRDITSTFNTWSFNLEDLEESYLFTDNDLPENSSLEVTLPSIQSGVSRLFRVNDKFSFRSELDIHFYLDGKRNVLFSNDVLSLNPSFGTELKYRNLIDFRFGLGGFRKEYNFDNTKYVAFQPSLGAGIHFDNFFIDYAITNLLLEFNGSYSNIFSFRYTF